MLQAEQHNTKLLSSSKLKMSKLQLLNVYVTQRLTAAATEISIAIETTVAELHEEISRSKEEVNRLRRLLISDHNPKSKLHQTDIQRLNLPRSEEEVPPEPLYCEQEWSPILGQENPGPVSIKEERHEPRTSQSVETRERNSLSTKTTEIKTEPDGEDWSLSEQTIDSQPLSEIHPDCSAAQSKNRDGAEVGSGGQPSGLKWTSKEEIAHTSAVGCIDRENVTYHLQTPIEEQHRCQDCGNLFSRMHHHTDEESHWGNACDNCNSIKGILTKHSAIQTREKSFRCQECGRFFTQKSSLTNHMMIHRGEKPYQCKLCGKCFTQTGSLSRHRKAHTGEKPFQCQECGKRFTQRVNLSSHMKIHRGTKLYTAPKN